MTVPSVRSVGECVFTQEQRLRFRSGVLWGEWACRYPELFDSDDCRLAERQAHHGAHFYEWRAAIFLFETMGYLSLVEKYEFPLHRRKHALARRILPPEACALLTRSAGGTRSQWPDLLAYSPGLDKWLLCEVKGPSDRMRPSQELFFEKLAAATGRPVGFLRVVRAGDEAQA